MLRFFRSLRFRFFQVFVLHLIDVRVAIVVGKSERGATYDVFCEWFASRWRSVGDLGRQFKHELLAYCLASVGIWWHFLNNYWQFVIKYWLKFVN